MLGAGVLLFRLELFELDAPLQGGDQLIDAERLLQVVEGSELERLDGAFGAGVRGHDDDDAGRIVRFEMLEQGDAVHRLHVDVGQDQVVFVGLVEGEGLFPIGGKRCGKARGLNHSIQHFMDRKQVVDNENRWHGNGSALSGTWLGCL